MIVIFQCTDSINGTPDEMIETVNDFSQVISETDSCLMIADLVTQIDLDSIILLSDFIYENIPYFLTDADYSRIDSLLSRQNYLQDCIEDSKRMLMFPSSGLLTANIKKDPLNLFYPVVSKLNRGASSDFFELYDGYIFTNDMNRCLVSITSPFGNSETQKNSALVQYLQDVATDVKSRHSSINIDFIGGPSIAVGNASQIKKDSIISVAISVVLILLLMLIVFRNIRNILLISVSILWGWVFALGILSLFHDSISLIVVGISSIILGIAVNYPLHLITHSGHTPNVRQTVREIISPLIIGNITTIGAFMALLPLESTALKDLGLFSAFLLAGTILFVVIYLPHILKVNPIKDKSHKKWNKWLIGIGNLTLENSKLGVTIVILLTILFAWFSLRTKFDSNMSHINYVTEEQQRNMEYFQQLTSGAGKAYQSLYVVSKGKNIDEALANSHRIHKGLESISNSYNETSLSSCVDFFIPWEIQEKRIKKWDAFITKYKEVLTTDLQEISTDLGFQQNAFEPFLCTIKKNYTPKPFDYFSPLYSMYTSHFSIDTNSENYRVVDILTVKESDVQSIKNQINAVMDELHFCFDVQGMNSALADNLSENFNYIGWACGLIVFIFLCFSFRNIELAIISFLPMAVSWIWILGIMGMTGIQFNIVNIILATFIFGQGDDYTIFMTEGCCYEYAYRRKMLASYKSSIIISALIMFIGIGSLIWAKHPALHSLAEVTIVGMFSVVLMAYMLPPLIFKWIVSRHGKYRKRPLTLVPLLRTIYCGSWWFTQLIIGYILGAFLFVFSPRTKRKYTFFRKFVTLCHKIDLRLMPGMKFVLHNLANENFNKPCIIVCNHQSILDPMFFMALNHKIIIAANEKSSMNPIVKIMFKWLGFYTIKNCNFTAWKDSSLERDLKLFREFINDGYSIVIFPEGVRNPESSILRYHKGPFYLAEELGVDILPVFLHGVNHIMPKGSFACYKGEVNMYIDNRIKQGHNLWGINYSQTTKLVHKYYAKQYAFLQKKHETTTFFIPLLLDRYKYKGTEVMAAIKKNLKRYRNYSDIIDHEIHEDTIFIRNAGYGEMALLFALVHPDKRIIACEADEEKLNLAKYAADGIVANLKYITMTANIQSDNVVNYDKNEL
ncbi:MAG: 1-acyl-sn-glycerol-3-phosphate acyltransferase [Bacteroidaceae bacterium]|nr:1-acyl-sn-glycerol-3-phosphate acyltransferase [Bacteroidaceae bacterium]